MFDNEVNKLFVSVPAITAPVEKVFLIAASRAFSVSTPPLRDSTPRISTQPVWNSSQSRRIFAA
jgi:hypothetical protein